MPEIAAPDKGRVLSLFLVAALDRLGYHPLFLVAAPIRIGYYPSLACGTPHAGCLPTLAYLLAQTVELRK